MQYSCISNYAMRDLPGNNKPFRFVICHGNSKYIVDDIQNEWKLLTEKNNVFLQTNVKDLANHLWVSHIFLSQNRKSQSALQQSKFKCKNTNEKFLAVRLCSRTRTTHWIRMRTKKEREIIIHFGQFHPLFCIQIACFVV